MTAGNAPGAIHQFADTHPNAGHPQSLCLGGRVQRACGGQHIGQDRLPAALRLRRHGPLGQEGAVRELHQAGGDLGAADVDADGTERRQGPSGAACGQGCVRHWAAPGV